MKGFLIVKVSLVKGNLWTENPEADFSVILERSWYIDIAEINHRVPPI
jgi:hypothetical protein